MYNRAALALALSPWFGEIARRYHDRTKALEALRTHHNQYHPECTIEHSSALIAEVMTMTS